MDGPLPTDPTATEWRVDRAANRTAYSRQVPDGFA